MILISKRAEDVYKRQLQDRGVGPVALNLVEGFLRLGIFLLYIGHISATADGVHLADTNGHFRVSGCDFSYMGDDSLNVHDNLLYICLLYTSRCV